MAMPKRPTVINEKKRAAKLKEKKNSSSQVPAKPAKKLKKMSFEKILQASADAGCCFICKRQFMNFDGMRGHLISKHELLPLNFVKKEPKVKQESQE